MRERWRKLGRGMRISRLRKRRGRNDDRGNYSLNKKNRSREGLRRRNGRERLLSGKLRPKGEKLRNST